MSVKEFSHDSLFSGLFVAFTYKKQPPAFDAFFYISLVFRSIIFQITYVITTY
jgi:hypothetical protein